MKRALIVDDTKNIRLMLQKCLEIENYEVDSACNGKDGLEMVLSNKYNLVFLDVKMPELSGTEVLRQMRARGVETPVIVITAYPTVKNAVDCTKMGAVAYLQKPFTPERLKGVLVELSCEVDEVERLIQCGKYKEAIEKISERMRSDPTNHQYYSLLANCYGELGDLGNAKKFQKCSEIFKD